MLRQYRSVLLPLALAAGLALPLGRVSDQVFRRMAADRFEIRYVPSGRALRFLSPGARLSIANYYWLMTVQYLGDETLRNRGYPELYSLIDLVTELDPQHGYAYQTGGIALSSAERLEESDAILRKGIEHGPNWWSYPFYIAFNHFFYRGDYAAAAEWAERAAKTPGASPNISKLALALKVKSGSPDDAVRLIEEMRGLARDERTAEALEEQYRLALLARDFARLDAAVQRFEAERGRPPAHLGDLVKAGIIGAIPRDPYGGTYVWRDGKVHSTGKDFRFPAPEPGRLRKRPAPYRTVP